MKRPHVLVMMSDQQQAGVMSCAGDPDVHTPAMDSIAESGVRFTRAYTDFPVCAPMRASMVTGQYPHQLGMTGNRGTDWESSFPPEHVLGNRLKDAGYACVWAGKDRVLDNWGYEKRCGYGDAGVGDSLVEFLEQHDMDQPFFAVGVFQNPHNICEWSRGQPLFEGPIPEEPKLEDMPLLPPNYQVAPYEAEAIGLYAGLHPSVYGDRYSKGDDFWRRHRWAYRRLVERVDTQVGRILDALEKRGERENTIIVYTSDHGDCDGAHRWGSKLALFEEAVKVPLLMSGPGIPAGKVEENTLVNVAMDHVPTILDCAGLPAPGWVDGDCRSYLPVARGLGSASPQDPSAAPAREHLFIESFLATTQGPSHGAARAVVREDGMKYCCYYHGQHREQMFDLNRDPGEMVNLAVHSRYADTLATFRKTLCEWCDRTADAGFRFQIPGHVIMSPGSEGW